MKRLKHTQTFLLELGVNLIFFCICTAVCLSLLAHAHGLSEESETLDRAVVAAENSAERFKAADGIMEAETIRYDANWNETAEEADYLLELMPEDMGNNLHKAQITVYAAKDRCELYTLTVRRFAGEVGA